MNADVRYETFISDELVKYVDSHYKTVADRKGRAITGLSMGGHGAMWNGLRHSDVFSAAGSTSGGVDIRPFPKNWEMSVQIGEKAKYPENWEKYTVINLVPTLRKDQIALIFDCGDSDFFLEVNKNYHEALLKQGIDHDFITRPGNHDSQYWNNSIDYQILFFWKHFLKMKPCDKTVWRFDILTFCKLKSRRTDFSGTMYDSLPNTQEKNNNSFIDNTIPKNRLSF